MTGVQTCALPIFLQIQSNKRLRKEINHPDSALSKGRNELFEFGKELTSHKNKKRLVAAGNYIKAQKDVSMENMELADMANIQMQQVTKLKKLSAFKLRAISVKDFFATLWEKSFNAVSTLIGNTAYHIHFGTGKLLDKVEVKEDIYTHARPMDVILVNAPFKLNAKLIPGYYGHAAVWLGTKEQLIEIGAWDELSPEVQRKIENGQVLLEARNWGIDLRTLESAMDIDSFVMITKNDISDAERKEKVLLGVKQIGKAFDYNFNAQDFEKLVCSEVVMVVYNEIEFKLNPKAGLYLITPNNVALKAFANDPIFSVSLLYNDGKKIEENIQESFEGYVKSRP